MSERPAIPDEARDALRATMTLHAQGEIDAAIGAANAIVDRWPQYGQALSYLGQTLVTRKRRFADGLAILDRALAAADDDPYILYTVGWCREFVANALARPKGAHQPVAETADALYAQARALMLRALELDPDDQLLGDIEDILDVITRATGEPWNEELREQPIPRPR